MLNSFYVNLQINKVLQKYKKSHLTFHNPYLPSKWFTIIYQIYVYIRARKWC